jgi:hypothetical protein
MRTAAVRKSITDLTRRRARAAFTILTLALAVASVGLLAVPPVMERAMQREVATSLVPDVSVAMSPTALTQRDLDALERLPNVAAVEPRSMVVARVWVGERRERALVIGVPDFAGQRADVVTVDDGAAPRTGQLVTHRNNRARKGFAPQTGGTARIVAPDGSEQALPITGVARNLTKGETDLANDWITFYATPGTVAALSGARGWTSLGLRLDDPSRPAAERTIAAVRDELRARTDFRTFSDLPIV